MSSQAKILFVLHVPPPVHGSSIVGEFIKKSSLINIGSGQEYTIKKFAKIINNITSANKVLKFNKKYPDGTKRKVLDLTYIKTLGWKPKISLENGLKNTIRWYKSNYIK